MGFVNKFGFGKKEPYRVPREVTALRTKIEAENRENFPHLARYKELTREATQVYTVLDAEIAKKTYAEDAAKLSEDIRKKMDGLADKIRKNTQEAKAEGGEDYIESNLDYLARKSLRNTAKTLFTEFLEAQERLSACIRVAGPGCSEVLGSAAVMIRTMAELNENYFRKHGSDREISGMREAVLSHIADIDRSWRETRAGAHDRTVAAAIESQVRRLLSASTDLSPA